MIVELARRTSILGRCHIPGNYGYLTERGTLFYNGKVSDDSSRFISCQPWKGGAALEADWNGRVLWEVRHPDHHRREQSWKSPGNGPAITNLSAHTSERIKL